MNADHAWLNCSVGQDFLSVRMTRALSAVLAERRRQIDQEGYTPQHDDRHAHGEIAQAAADYLSAEQILTAKNSWALHKARHPRRRQLVIGAALALAEIERVDRLTPVMKLEDRAASTPFNEGNPSEAIPDIWRAELHMLRTSHDQELCRRVALDQQFAALIQKIILAVKTDSLPKNLAELEAWLLQKEAPNA